MQPQDEPTYWQPNESADPAVLSSPEPPTPEVEAQHDDGPITWQASEFVHYEKSGIWFLALLGVAAVLLILDVLIIQSWTFGALILVMTLGIIVVGRRPPRTMTYTVSAQGIQIDDKHFSFHDFKAFGVVQEGAVYSIRLIPVKRFMPMVSVYFPTEYGEQIVDMFGAMLPMEQIKLDPIDRFVEKIRF